MLVALLENRSHFIGMHWPLEHEGQRRQGQWVSNAGLHHAHIPLLRIFVNEYAEEVI